MSEVNCIETEHGTFCDVIHPETGLVIKTAQELYDEWLADNTQKEELTTEQKLEKLTEEYNKLRCDTDNLIKENEMLKGSIIEISQEIYN